MKTRAILLLCCLFSIGCFAQPKASDDTQDRLRLEPSGWILMDGGVFITDNKSLPDGVSISDFGIGVKAVYGQYRSGLAIGYQFGRVWLKDIFIERQFNPSLRLKVGHFYHQFGLQSAISTILKDPMEDPVSNEGLYNGRLVGGMLTYDKEKFYATASLFAETQAMMKYTNEIHQQGYGAMSRLLFRPLRIDGTIMHVGISGAFETPRFHNTDELRHKSFSFGARYPIRMSSLRAVEATVADAENLFKFTPELLVSYGPLAFESQYYYTQVNRAAGLPNYRAHAAYAMLRGLIIGKNYQYNEAVSTISACQSGGLECVLSGSYLDLSDHQSGILGGRMTDIALGLNYNINRYLSWHFRYSFTRVTDRAGFPDQTLNGFQTRLEIIF